MCLFFCKSVFFFFKGFVSFSANFFFPKRFFEGIEFFFNFFPNFFLVFSTVSFCTFFLTSLFFFSRSFDEGFFSLKGFWSQGTFFFKDFLKGVVSFLFFFKVFFRSFFFKGHVFFFSEFFLNAFFCEFFLLFFLMFFFFAFFFLRFLFFSSDCFFSSEGFFFLSRVLSFFKGIFTWVSFFLLIFVSFFLASGFVCFCSFLQKVFVSLFFLHVVLTSFCKKFWSSFLEGFFFLQMVMLLVCFFGHDQMTGGA